MRKALHESLQSTDCRTQAMLSLELFSSLWEACQAFAISHDIPPLLALVSGLYQWDDSDFRMEVSLLRRETGVRNAQHDSTEVLAQFSRGVYAAIRDCAGPSCGEKGFSPTWGIF